MEESNLFGHRLRQARVLSGLSMEGLSQRMDGAVSKQAISKYEQGVMFPTSEIFIKLCEVLGRSEEFFARPITCDMSKVPISFRKKAGVGKRAMHVLQERIADEVERWLEIDEILHSDGTIYTPLESPCEVVRTVDDIERCARYVRDAWHIGYAPISTVQGLLANKGITVLQCEGVAGFDGVSAMVSGRWMIVLNKDIAMCERQRFTTLHELGHLLFNGSFAEDLDSRTREHLCHAFANEMLLPTAVVTQWFARSKEIRSEELMKVQQVFGISIDAIVYKLHLLGIVPYKRYKQYYMLKHSDAQFKELMDCSRYNEPNLRLYETKVHVALSQGLITSAKASALLSNTIGTSTNVNGICL